MTEYGTALYTWQCPHCSAWVPEGWYHSCLLPPGVNAGTICTTTAPNAPPYRAIVQTDRPPTFSPSPRGSAP